MLSLSNLYWSSFDENLQDDTEWQNVSVEAAGFQMPKQLRQMFAIILIHRGPTDPLYLCTAHKHVLCEDYAEE